MPVNPPVRIPISWDYNSRSPTAPANNIDSRRLNVMDEPKVGQEGFYTKTRPVFASVASLGTTGLGQAVTSYQGSQFAVIADQLVTAGPPNSGTNGSAFTSEPNAAWQPRTQFGVVVLNDTMFVLGGNLNAGIAGDVWATRDGINWTVATGSAPWGARSGFGCCVFNKLIYVIAGNNFNTSTFLNDVWSSPDGTNWTQVTASAAFSPRTTFATISTNNGIYILGGFKGASPGTATNEVWFSSDGINWTMTTSAAGWAVRGYIASANYNNTLFIWGGSDSITFYNDCWASTDGGVSWTQKTAAAFAGQRFAQGSCVYNNKMWSFGGEDNTLTQKSEVYTSTDGITWTLVTSSPGWNARAFPGIAVFRTPTAVSASHYPTIWVMGGHPTGAATNDVWYGNLNIAIGGTTALSPAVASQVPYSFNSFVEGTRLLIKNQSNMWVYDSGGVTKVTDSAYPTETVPGIVCLGAFAYVMDPTGLIRNCIIDDPFHWPSLNAIGADYDDDAGVCLAKYMNFAVAFGTFTTQLFYDAGRSPGSPLLPYSNANMKVGCYDALSVVEMGNTVVWMTNSKQSRRQIAYFNGVTPEVISTPFIEDVLYSGNVLGAYGIAFQKHQFYVITINNSSPSWAYDFLTKKWYEWSLGAVANAYLIGTAMGPGTAGTAPYLLNGPTGQLLQLSGSGGADFSGTPTTLLATPKMDLGNNRIKFWGQFEVIGDRSASLPTIDYSDDDYSTWSTPRAVDMSQPRPILYRNGASRRRAFRLVVSDGIVNRFDGFEITVEQ